MAVDTSDAPLRELVAGLPGSAPDLMKPNGEELASLTGSDPEAVEADPLPPPRPRRCCWTAASVRCWPPSAPTAPCSPTREGAWHATPPPTTVVSTVGAGDSSLFGYLLADLRGGSPVDRLTMAVAYGSAAAGLPGTTIPDPTHIRPEQVEACRLDAITPGGRTP